MAFPNPSDATEILYGTSGDVRSEINAYASVTTAGHYIDETEMPGGLVVASLRKATRLINSYLEPTYADQIPFLTTGAVPKQLDEAASDIATFYCLRSMTANLGPVSAEKKRDYFDQYIDPANGFLMQIRNRMLQLPELTVSYPDDTKSVRATNVAPIFDVDKDFAHEVDPRLLDDIDRERGN